MTKGRCPPYIYVSSVKIREKLISGNSILMLEFLTMKYCPLPKKVQGIMAY